MFGKRTVFSLLENTLRDISMPVPEMYQSSLLVCVVDQRGNHTMCRIFTCTSKLNYSNCLTIVQVRCPTPPTGCRTQSFLQLTDFIRDQSARCYATWQVKQHSITCFCLQRRNACCLRWHPQWCSPLLCVFFYHLFMTISGLSQSRVFCCKICFFFNITEIVWNRQDVSMWKFCFFRK